MNDDDDCGRSDFRVGVECWILGILRDLLRWFGAMQVFLCCVPMKDLPIET